MSTAAAERAATADSKPSIQQLLRDYPADPRLMSSPEGDERGLAELRREAEVDTAVDHE